MERSKFYSLLILVVSLVLLTTALQKQTSAQSVQFDGVVPFSTTGGLMGFFNQKDGKLYLYDPNLA